MRSIFLSLLAFGLGSATFYGQSSAALTAAGCSVRAASFQGWDAQVVTNRWVRLTFIPKLGGRIMQVEFNGHPYLFVNPKYLGQYISPQEAHGGWINYGGDKIWPMPEGDSDESHWRLASTAIDDLPYTFKVLSEGERCIVELVGQPDTITGLQYSRTISLSAESPEIGFHAVMKNATDYPIEWSVQSVSQYDLGDHQNPADYNHHFFAYTPVNAASSYPDGYHVRSGLADDPSFSVADDVFQFHWGYFDNEVWLDSSAGWLAVVDQQTQYGMIERFNFLPNGSYPGKATVIFSKNGPSVSFDKEGRASIPVTKPESTPYYMEAEINSPIVRQQPNETYAMDTTWSPIRINNFPQAVTNAGVVTQRLSATRHGENTTLNGTFSTFIAGNLTAVFMSGHGTELSRHVLREVHPEENVVLDDHVPFVSEAMQVVVKLFDVRGEDHGILDKANIETPGSVSR